MKKNKIIYSLSEEDIQEVASEEIGRNLSEEEIQKIIPSIEEKINWYEIIYYSICENIESDDVYESDDE